MFLSSNIIPLGNLSGLKNFILNLYITNAYGGGGEGKPKSFILKYKTYVGWLHITTHSQNYEISSAFVKNIVIL